MILLSSCVFKTQETKANIVIILFNDFEMSNSFTSKNEILQTLVFNKFKSESVEFQNFNVINIDRLTPENIFTTCSNQNKKKNTTNANLKDILIANDYKIINSEANTFDKLTDNVISFMKNEKSKPFFCFIPIQFSENNFQVDNDILNKYRRLGCNDSIALLYERTENIDKNVGRILQTLDTLQISENTIVIWMSNNNTKREFNNSVASKESSEINQHKLNIPFFIRFPRKLKNLKPFTKQVADIDMLPTILELSGINIPVDFKIEGESLVPFLLSAEEKKVEGLISNNK